MTDDVYAWRPSPRRRPHETQIRPVELIRLERAETTGSVVITVERQRDGRLYVVTDKRVGFL